MKDIVLYQFFGIQYERLINFALSKHVSVFCNMQTLLIIVIASKSALKFLEIPFWTVINESNFGPWVPEGVLSNCPCETVCPPVV